MKHTEEISPQKMVVPEFRILMKPKSEP